MMFVQEKYAWDDMCTSVCNSWKYTLWGLKKMQMML